MKAWWKVYDKPRGRWYPRLEWGVTFTSSEMEEMEALNVKTSIRYCFRGGVKPHPPCDENKHGKRIIAFFPAERVFSSDCTKVGSQYNILGQVGCCSDCPGNNGNQSQWCRFDHIDLNPDRAGVAWAVRLPWRPGARPDYSDFIDPVREFLYRVMEEFESRFDEARESAPSDEWMLEEEFDSFSWRTENEAAEKKLRVIRR